MGFDDAKHGREAEAGAFALILSGKKWIEDTVDDVWRNTATGIGNRDKNVRAGLCAGIGLGGRFVDDDILRGNDKLSAFGHGVARVYTKVHDHLAELSGVAFDEMEVGDFIRVDGNGARQGFPYQLNDVTDDEGGLHRQALTFGSGTPGKGEHLADQARAMMGAGVHDIQQADQALVGDFMAEHVHGYENGREGVIEIMRNAARQGANAFKALCPEKLLFEFVLLGDVGVDD